MLCFAMFCCYVMLCLCYVNVMLCYAMLCYVMLCYVMLWLKIGLHYDTHDSSPCVSIWNLSTGLSLTWIRWTLQIRSLLLSSSSGANRTLGHGCPNEFTPDSPILRSVPGGEKADVGWFQVSLNSVGPRECRSPSSPLPVPRLAMDGSIQSTVVVQPSLLLGLQ